MRPNVPQSRRKPVRRRRRSSRNGLFGVIKMATVLSIIVVALILVIRLIGNQGSTQQVFLDGVYVNGIPLGGYGYAEGYELVQQLAYERLNVNAIQVNCQGKTWTITPAMLDATYTVDEQVAMAWNFGHTGNWAQRRDQASFLRDNPQHFNSTLSYNEEILDQFIAQIKSEIDVAPVSAEPIIGTDETITIVPSQDGLEIDGEALKQQLVSAIVEGTTAVIDIIPQVARPEVTTEQLQQSTQLIATFRTSTKTSSSDRTSNVRRALSKFNGFYFANGETASFNEVVGKRTEANGFKPAVEYDGATEVDGIGGGVCQASTTLYGALLRAGVTVERRYNHTMTVGYVKPSQDAAVSDSGKDLVFTNNTGYDMYIYTSVDGERAEAKIFGHPTEYLIEIESEIIQANIEAKGFTKVEDTRGKYVYYTDERYLAKEGKPGMRSRAIIIYKDRQTGEEVSREVLSTDYYEPMKPTYYVGVHSREEEVWG